MVSHPETGSDSPIGSNQDRGRDKFSNSILKVSGSIPLWSLALLDLGSSLFFLFLFFFFLSSSFLLLPYGFPQIRPIWSFKIQIFLRPCLAIKNPFLG